MLGECPQKHPGSHLRARPTAGGGGAGGNGNCPPPPAGGAGMGGQGEKGTCVPLSACPLVGRRSRGRSGGSCPLPRGLPTGGPSRPPLPSLGSCGAKLRAGRPPEKPLEVPGVSSENSLTPIDYLYLPPRTFAQMPTLYRSPDQKQQGRLRYKA